MPKALGGANRPSGRKVRRASVQPITAEVDSHFHAVTVMPPSRWSKLCGARTSDTGERLVYANNPDKNATLGYCDNTISNTKYTWWDFIFKNLAEQFSRHINRYFLLIACLQLWSEITPVDPATTWAPLIVIFGVTAIKELLDDLGRRKEDKKANGREYNVIRNGRDISIRSCEICVGDIVKLHEDEEIPCDLMLLSTSNENGICFIQTTNLDGESNLKTRAAKPETAAYCTDASIATFRGVVICQNPDDHGFDNLDKFDSALKLSEGDSATPVSLDISQLLLQATHLRNTKYIYGLAVYTGNETKFGKNKKHPPTKFTKTDVLMNEFSAVIFLFQLLLVIVFGVVGNVWKNQHQGTLQYLRFASDEPAYQFIIIPLRFLLLNSTMIPISLKVTLDLCKLFYSRFINNDLHLYDHQTDQPAHSNSTALSEDLGQVEYILSDKTGTLTENVMVLKVCTIDGVQYGAPPTSGVHPMNGSTNQANGTSFESVCTAVNERGMMEDPRLRGAVFNDVVNNNNNVCALEFLRCIALNNGVFPSINDKTKRRQYKASSPDEEALVDAASHYGVALIYRERGDVRIMMPNSQTSQHGINLAQDPFGSIIESIDSNVPAYKGLIEEHWQQLEEFEFNSDRKRMSVLVRNVRTRSLRLYCKGADDVILARLSPSIADTARTKQMVKQIDTYAATGLRTLVMAYRDVSTAEYEQWKFEFDKANALRQGRDEAKEKCYTRMERDLIILGATAIEDKLQDQVPETIDMLKRAGLKIWMCTGDKYSTAQTIAKTCSLWPRESPLLSIEGDDPVSVRNSLQSHISSLRAKGHQLSELPAEMRGPFKNLRQQLGCCIPQRKPMSESLDNKIPSKLSQSQPDAVADAQHSLPARTTSSIQDQNDIGKLPGRRSGSLHGRNVRIARMSMTASIRRLAVRDVSKTKSPNGFVVIIRGSTLRCALEHALEEFAAVCLTADAVICCRVTPRQKAELVALVRRAGHLTVAVGDGGNDVSMIQEANVGIGIRGKEGLQAARASDYQINWFKSLQRLLLIHGRYSYYRTSLVVQYSFYKSFLFCFLQIGYGFFSGFAGVSLFNSLSVAAYNAVLFVPIIFFFLDKDIQAETALAFPQTYGMCRRGEFMHYGTMLKWFLRAIYHAFIFLVVIVSFAPVGATVAAYDVIGLVAFLAYLWVQDFTMLLELRRITWYNVFTIFGLHAIAFIIGIGWNMVSSTTAWSFMDYYTFNKAITNLSSWFAQLLILVACIVPIEAIKSWHLRTRHTYYNRMLLLDHRLQRSVNFGKRETTALMSIKTEQSDSAKDQSMRPISVSNGFYGNHSHSVDPTLNKDSSLNNDLNPNLNGNDQSSNSRQHTSSTSASTFDHADSTSAGTISATQSNHDGIDSPHTHGQGGRRGTVSDIHYHQHSNNFNTENGNNNESNFDKQRAISIGDLPGSYRLPQNGEYSPPHSTDSSSRRRRTRQRKSYFDKIVQYSTRRPSASEGNERERDETEVQVHHNPLHRPGSARSSFTATSSAVEDPYNAHP